MKYKAITFQDFYFSLKSLYFRKIASLNLYKFNLLPESDQYF